jgi:hypothetical protein
MKHRFLLHSISHNFLVVDITSVSDIVNGSAIIGASSMVPAERFKSWDDVENHLHTMGASQETLRDALAQLKKCSLAVVTVV